MSIFNNNGKRDREQSMVPKEARVPMPQADVPEKFIPKRHQSPVDESQEAMARASQAYDALRHECAALRTQLESSLNQIADQRHRINVLELTLSEAKNDVVSYRAEADEARAVTAGWQAFFANVKAVFNQYEIPNAAPKKKPDDTELIPQREDVKTLPGHGPYHLAQEDEEHARAAEAEQRKRDAAEGFTE